MPNAFNHSEQHIQEYLHALLAPGHTAQAVIAYANLVSADDFGGHWQAVTAWRALIDAAELAQIMDGENATISTMDVHESLMRGGHMNKASFAQYWLQLVAPPSFVPPPPAAKIPTLANRIIEDRYRQCHSDIYGGGSGSWGAPLDNLFEQVGKDYERLRAIEKRLAGGQTQEEAA